MATTLNVKAIAEQLYPTDWAEQDGLKWDKNANLRLAAEKTLEKLFSVPLHNDVCIFTAAYKQGFEDGMEYGRQQKENLNK